MPVVLNVDASTNYEPSKIEIIEYAKWLGMDLPEDNQFLWIAREGLKAPLPENWKACQSDKGELYYFNLKTGQSIWDHPMDDYFKTLFANEKKNPTSRSISRDLKCEHDRAQPTTGLKAKRRVTEILKETTQQGNAEPRSDLKTRELNCLKIRKEPHEEVMADFDMAIDKTELTSLSKAPKDQSAKPCDSLSGAAKKSEGKNCSSVRGISLVNINSSKELGRICKRSKANNTVSSTVKSTLATPTKEKEDPRGDFSEVKARDPNTFAPLDTTNLQKEEEKLQDVQDQKLRALQESFEEERQQYSSAFKKKLNDALKEDQSKMESATTGSREHLGKKSSSQQEEELNKMIEPVKEHQMLETKEAEAEEAGKLKTPIKEPKPKCEFLPKNGIAELKEFQTVVSNHLGECVSTFLNEYEEAYSLFSRKVIESENNFARRVAQQEAHMQRELDFELIKLRQNNEHAMKEEIEKSVKKMQEAKQQHQQYMGALYESNQAELKGILQNIIKHINSKSNAEKKLLTTVENSPCRVPPPELDNIMKESEKKSEAQFKTAQFELADQQENLLESKRLTAGSILHMSNNTLSREEPVEDLNRKSECHNPQKIRSIGENLISTTSPDTDLHGLSPCSENYDVKSIITKTLKEVFSESPFIQFSQLTNNGKCSSTDLPRPTQSVTPSVAADEQAPHAKNFTFPASFQGLHELIMSERRQVHEGQMFVKNQRKNIEERRQQLKHTRHQWKQDVLAAKKDGAKSSSKKGQLLSKVRMVLEEQAQGLQHDESILHESEVWLLSKEQRLINLERQIKEQESHQFLGENFSGNCSLDTAGLVVNFFEPQCNFTSELLRPSSRSYLGSITLFERGAPSPMLSKTIGRIEESLGESTSTVKIQKSHRNPSAPLPGSRNCLTPSLSLPRSSKNCHINFHIHMGESDLKQTIHTDPL